MTALRVDSFPVGSERAAVGSPEWAEHVRVYSLSVVDRAREIPATFQRVHRLITEHRAWRLLKGPDGKAFRSIEDFSACAKPHGWGTPYAQLRPILEVSLAGATEETVVGPVAVDAGNVLQLAEAPVPQKPKAGPGRGKKKTTPPEAVSFSDPTHGRTQAILRAPAPVQTLFRAGLIGEKDAARLGPKKAKNAARIDEAVAAAQSVVLDHGPPKDERDKRKLKTKVNAAVRGFVPPPARPVPAPDESPVLVPDGSGITESAVKDWLLREASDEARRHVAIYAANLLGLRVTP